MSNVKKQNYYEWYIFDALKHLILLGRQHKWLVSRFYQNMLQWAVNALDCKLVPRVVAWRSGNSVGPYLSLPEVTLEAV